MATATLTLNARVRVTLPTATDDVRRVVIPVGTKRVKFTCDEAIYLDGAASADEGATTVAQQFKYLAGTYDEDVYTFLGITPPAHKHKPLETATSVYISGTSADQTIWMHPVQQG